MQVFSLTIVLAMFLWTALSSATARNGDASSNDPRDKGPFEVGNRTHVFIDESRHDPATDSARTLVTEVWYPAADSAASLPRDTLRDFLGQWDEFVIQMLEDEGAPPGELANFDRETGASRDAAIHVDSAPYPIILFSHGNGGVRFQNLTMCEYLASHGFIVIAPDHTGNAFVAPLEDEPVVFDENLVTHAYWARMADLSFLITVFDQLDSSDPDGFWTGMLDTENVGAFGHSFGGAAVLETTRRDRRIKATISMAGFIFPWRAEDFDGASTMWMIALEDDTLGDVTSLMRLDYGILPPPKFKLEFLDGGHYTFTDACILFPSLFGDGDGCGTGERRWGGEPFDFIDHDEAFSIINPYAAAFFGFNLRGDDHMGDFLEENHAPDDIRYRTLMTR